MAWCLISEKTISRPSTRRQRRTESRMRIIGLPGANRLEENQSCALLQIAVRRPLRSGLATGWAAKRVAVSVGTRCPVVRTNKLLVKRQ